MARIVNPACPFCNERIPEPTGKTYEEFDCRKCGSFGTRGLSLLGLDNERLSQNIGFWIRDQVELGERPLVTPDVIKIVKQLREKTVIERAERLLRYGIREQKDLAAVLIHRTSDCTR